MGNHAFQPPPGYPQPKKSTGKTVTIVLLVIYGVLSTAWGCAATLAAGSTPSTTAGVRPPATATESETPEPEPTTAAPVKPTRKDLSLGIKELGRDCYGTAGCNVTYRIRLTLERPEKFAEGTTYEVSYEVRGGDQVESGTFTLLDGVATVSESDMISTPPNPRLKAVVTEIEARL